MDRWMLEGVGGFSRRGALKLRALGIAVRGKKL